MLENSCRVFIGSPVVEKKRVPTGGRRVSSPKMGSTTNSTAPKGCGRNSHMRKRTAPRADDTAMPVMAQRAPSVAKYSCHAKTCTPAAAPAKKEARAKILAGNMPYEEQAMAAEHMQHANATSKHATCLRHRGTMCSVRASTTADETAMPAHAGRAASVINDSKGLGIKHTARPRQTPTSQACVKANPIKRQNGLGSKAGRDFPSRMELPATSSPFPQTG